MPSQLKVKCDCKEQQRKLGESAAAARLNNTSKRTVEKRKPKPALFFAGVGRLQGRHHHRVWLCEAKSGRICIGSERERKRVRSAAASCSTQVSSGNSARESAQKHTYIWACDFPPERGLIFLRRRGHQLVAVGHFGWFGTERFEILEYTREEKNTLWNGLG